MSICFDAHKPSTSFESERTLAVALELSGKSWEAAAVVPGVARRPWRRLDPQDIGSLLATIEGWKAEARKAKRHVTRVVLTYEAGRDGFWIARALIEKGIEVYVMQPSSVPVERQHRRAKTDRIDLDMLLRTLLAWLRGEPRVCSMVRIPSEAEESARLPGRDREQLVRSRVAIENRIKAELILHGISSFKPRLKKAVEQLERLRTPVGLPLPIQIMESLQRLMAQHALITSQIKQIEEERAKVLIKTDPDREERMIRLLVGFYGLGLDTATVLVREMLCRSFRDRRAIASFAGLTGTPFRSGHTVHEQGISKAGNSRVRHVMIQLAWRWLKFQTCSKLSRWFFERTGGAKGRIRKIMIVAVARKLLVSLWRFIDTGIVPEGARLAPAS